MQTSGPTAAEIRSVLELCHPPIQSLDDETIDRVAAGQDVVVPSSKFEVSVDVQQIVDVAIKLVPLIAASLAMVKTTYDLWRGKRVDQAVDELYQSSVAKKPDLFKEVSEEAAKEVIRSSMFAVSQSLTRDAKP